MSINLALKYRPKTFRSISGQRAVSALLQQMVVNGTVPSVVLFEGMRGSGKTSTARVLAAALNCESKEPCGICESCKAIFEGLSLSVREIDASSHGLVDDIRQLQEDLLYGVPGKKSVIILDEVQGLSRAAANALLRTLENPPEHVVFILITTEAPKVLSTIRSRCMSFNFRRLATEIITERLAYVRLEENLEIAPELLPLIAESSEGSLRDALLSLDQLARAGITDLDAYTLLIGEPDFGVVFLQSLLSRRHSKVFAILEDALSKTDKASTLIDNIIMVLKDILILTSGGTVAAQGARLTNRQLLADKLEMARIVAALRALWDLKIKLRSFDEARHGVLYLLATVLMEELIPAASGDSQPLTLAEVQDRVVT